MATNQETVGGTLLDTCPVRPLVSACLRGEGKDLNQRNDVHEDGSVGTVACMSERNAGIAAMSVLEFICAVRRKWRSS